MGLYLYVYVCMCVYFAFLTPGFVYQLAAKQPEIALFYKHYRAFLFDYDICPETWQNILPLDDSGISKSALPFPGDAVSKGQRDASAYLKNTHTVLLCWRANDLPQTLAHIVSTLRSWLLLSVSETRGKCLN